MNNTSVHTPSQSGQTPEQTREIEAMLQLQEQKSSSTVYNKFKVLWNKHKIARLVTGITLAGSAVVATASGATVLAGGFLATRALLGALGGYMATDAAFDLANNKFSKNKLEKLIARMDVGESAESLEGDFREIHRELSLGKNPEEIEQEIEKTKKHYAFKKTTKRIVSSVVWIGIGLIWGSHVMETATNSGETIELVKSKVSGILDGKVSPPTDISSPPPKVTIKDIFDDIHADHPNQGYVTLEQTVRRIEWLKTGIDLNHSEHLTSMNTSIYTMIRNPEGNIIQAMKELNMLSEGQSFEESAKRLTQEQIAKIIEKTYGADLVSEWSHSAAVIPPESLGKIRNVPVPKEIKIPLPVPESSSLSWTKVAWIGALALGLFAWFSWFTARKSRISWTDTTPPHLSETRQETLTSSDMNTNRMDTDIYPIPTPKVNVPEEEIISETPIETEDASTNADTSHDSMDDRTAMRQSTQERLSEEERLENFAWFIRVMENKFSFQMSPDDSNVEDSYGQIVCKKQTLGWEFKTTFIQSPGVESTMELSWYDAKKKKFTVTRPVVEPTQIFSIFEEMFMQSLLERDRIKNEEMLSLKTVEVSQADLRSMYTQLEHPYVLEHGTETGGFWFQSCYELQNGTLRFYNLANPTMDEMEITSGSFSIIPVPGRPQEEDYMYRNKNTYLRNTFCSIERKYIAHIHNTVLAEYRLKGQEMASMTGAINNYNYHKHPGYLNHPSSADLNQITAGRGRFQEQIHTRVLTWAIVNELPAHINESNKPANSLILRKNTYGWQRSYIVSFWKLHRNATNSNYQTSDCIPLQYRVI